MIAVDTNILVYAHREELPRHERAAAWVRRLAESPRPWGLPVFCLGEFVRVVTHRAVFDPPSTIAEATDALAGFLESPSVRLLSPGAAWWELLREALTEADARGNLAFDAQIVAVCREHGVVRLLTDDRDFGRFADLQAVALDDPLPEAAAT